MQKEIMSSAKDYAIDEVFKKVCEVSEYLNKANERLELLLKPLEKTHAEIKKIKNTLNEGAAIDKASDRSLLDDANVVEEIVAKTLAVSMKHKLEIYKNMDKLQLSCDRDYFRMMSQIIENHTSVNQIIGELIKNPVVNSFFQVKQSPQPK